jgi:hypothetical protein
VTFYNAPWALDGATISSALARRAQYAAMSGGEGIINAADLKVSQLAVAGNGLLISAGNAAITNRYQTDPNETYTVANPGTHTILSTEMPTSQPTAKSYLVLITIGDPEFSQVGHPWMTSDVLDPEEAADYVYVRPWLLEVAAGTTSFDGLGLNYPALALARVDVPANTTTITNAMITDLRTMARPRSKELIVQTLGLTGDMRTETVAAWHPFGGSWSVSIPKWATVAYVTGWVESMIVEGTRGATADMRANLVNCGITPVTRLDENNYNASLGDWVRVAKNIGGPISIPAPYRGTSQTFRTEAYLFADSPFDSLILDSASSSLFRIRFEESPV